jgi:hypothetical protein
MENSTDNFNQMIYRRIFLFTFCILQFVFCYAQNLVPNPSFEQYTICPDNPSSPLVDEVSRCIGWSTFSETPDYYNACADSISYVNVPYTFGGYHQAASGNAFCGMICTCTTIPNYREIIGCHLTSPLQNGKTYYISFKVSMSYGGLMGNYVASNGIGIKFTTKQNSYNNPIPIDNSPIIYSSSIITDSVNWITISGSFIADSAYEYLAIGNFFDDNHTDTLLLGPVKFRSYYFVDDICVSNESESCLINVTDNLMNNGFEIFPNPTHNIIYIKSFKCITSINLYDITGELLFTLENNEKNMTGIYKIDCSQFKPGIYFITILNNNLKSTKKIIIN